MNIEDKREINYPASFDIKGKINHAAPMRNFKLILIIGTVPPSLQIFPALLYNNKSLAQWV